ncbi:hypothetical protein M0812_25937 [Anaeramoeba flamelloides]|uniref:Uncharacterized protein n=1 Tax=Anaeramoeba flamelloides TaxID=1746091 RepID=A0AAV7YJZ2_9EUKA|nr:hypothetical protein M0812_25937 [Anaeramoeba flamelloides]
MFPLNGTQEQNEKMLIKKGLLLNKNEADSTDQIEKAENFNLTSIPSCQRLSVLLFLLMFLPYFAIKQIIVNPARWLSRLLTKIMVLFTNANTDQKNEFQSNSSQLENLVYEFFVTISRYLLKWLPDFIERILLITIQTLLKIFLVLPIRLIKKIIFCALKITSFIFNKIKRLITFLSNIIDFIIIFLIEKVFQLFVTVLTFFFKKKFVKPTNNLLTQYMDWSKLIWFSWWMKYGIKVGRFIINLPILILTKISKFFRDLFSDLSYFSRCGNTIISFILHPFYSLYQFIFQ